MKLSVIIPCYNEINTIETIVRSVKESPYPDKEIVVVDDCSTDGTRDVLRNKVEPLVERVIYHERNMGKGAAVREAVKSINGDIVIIQDADLEYNPEEYPKLIAPILNGRADVVYGSRFMGSEAHRVLYFWHRIGNGVLTLISNALTNLNLTDIETCYKVFRGNVLKSIEIEEDRFGFDPEITAKIAKKGCRVYEVGISYYGRTYEEGKKIGWKDGITVLRSIIKYNLFRN
jgi:glycosyltransferase involved in cell wall biosynthesis